MSMRYPAPVLLITALIAALTIPFSPSGMPALAAAPAGQAPAVPAEYADLYATLDGRLRAIDSYISSRWANVQCGVRRDYAWVVPWASGGAGTWRSKLPPLWA
jgi:hypothetical protein